MNKYLAFNCLIACVAIIIIIIAGGIIVAYSTSINLQEKTGIVSEFENREKHGLTIFRPMRQIARRISD